MELEKLVKNKKGHLLLENKAISAVKVGEEIINEPLLVILGSRGKYDPVRCRRLNIPENADAYCVSVIETKIYNPWEVSLYDYKVYRIEFFSFKKLEE